MAPRVLCISLKIMRSTLSFFFPTVAYVFSILFISTLYTFPNPLDLYHHHTIGTVWHTSYFYTTGIIQFENSLLNNRIYIHTSLDACKYYINLYTANISHQVLYITQRGKSRTSYFKKRIKLNCPQPMVEYKNYEILNLHTASITIVQSC